MNVSAFYNFDNLARLLLAPLIALMIAPADAASSGRILDVNAPVKVTFCELFKENMVVTPNGHYYTFGNVPYFQASDANRSVIAMHLGVHLLNTDARTADAVEVKFEMFDSFGRDTKRFYRATFKGTFGTGIDVDHAQKDPSYGTIGASDPGDVANYDCSVTAVHFTDGTTWFPSPEMPRLQFSAEMEAIRDGNGLLHLASTDCSNSAVVGSLLVEDLQRKLQNVSLANALEAQGYAKRCEASPVSREAVEAESLSMNSHGFAAIALAALGKQNYAKALKEIDQAEDARNRLLADPRYPQFENTDAAPTRTQLDDALRTYELFRSRVLAAE